MPDYEVIIRELQEYYVKHGKSKPIEYVFGFFDAVAVLRRMQEERVV